MPDPAKPRVVSPNLSHLSHDDFQTVAGYVEDLINGKAGNASAFSQELQKAVVDSPRLMQDVEAVATQRQWPDHYEDRSRSGSIASAYVGNLIKGEFKDTMPPEVMEALQEAVARSKELRRAAELWEQTKERAAEASAREETLARRTGGTTQSKRVNAASGYGGGRGDRGDKGDRTGGRRGPMSAPDREDDGRTGGRRGPMRSDPND